MKEQVLSTGDRAALQGLIALAGTLGIGALLTRLMPSRVVAPDRHLGFIVFELFSVVAILATSAITAYASIWFLHQNKAMVGEDLARVAAPLLLALVLLVLLVALGRLATLPRGLDLHFPLVLAVLTIAGALGLSVIFIDLKADGIVGMAVAFLVLAGGLSWLLYRMERRDMQRRRQDAFQRAGALAAAGYSPKARPLRPVLPVLNGEAERFTVACWIRDGRIFLDQESASRLEREVSRRWTEFARGNAVAPADDRVLSEVRLKTSLFPWPPVLVLRLGLAFKLGHKPILRSIKVDEKGLFELTGLALVDRQPTVSRSGSTP